MSYTPGAAYPGRARSPPSSRIIRTRKLSTRMQVRRRWQFAHTTSLCDLRQDLRPVSYAVHKGADIQLLVAQMVELEHDRVVLAAVDTRVVEEILNDSPSILVLRSL